MLVIAIILGLLVGLVNFPDSMGDFLAIGRTFGYMPIFLIGYYFKNSEEYYKSMHPTFSSKLKSFLLN